MGVARISFRGNTFRKFSKKFLRKLRKCIFPQKFNKPCVNFSRVWTKDENCLEILKVFDENSIENLNFYFIFNFIFQKRVTKNRAFGNNTIFLQQFFRFLGRDFRLPPGYALGNSLRIFVGGASHSLLLRSDTVCFEIAR